MTKEQIDSYNRKAEEVLKNFEDDPSLPSDATPLEKCILIMRNLGYRYESIQNKLGSIPKSMIRETLKKYNPNLITLDTNYHKIPNNLHKDYDWNWEDFKKGH